MPRMHKKVMLLSVLFLTVNTLSAVGMDELDGGAPPFMRKHERGHGRRVGASAPHTVPDGSFVLSKRPPRGHGRGKMFAPPPAAHARHPHAASEDVSGDLFLRIKRQSHRIQIDESCILNTAAANLKALFEYKNPLIEKPSHVEFVGYVNALLEAQGRGKTLGYMIAKLTTLGLDGEIGMPPHETSAPLKSPRGIKTPLPRSRAGKGEASLGPENVLEDCVVDTIKANLLNLFKARGSHYTQGDFTPLIHITKQLYGEGVNISQMTRLLLVDHDEGGAAAEGFAPKPDGRRRSSTSDGVDGYSSKSDPGISDVEDEEEDD